MNRCTLAQQRQIAEERRLNAEQLEAEAVGQRDTIRTHLYRADMRMAAVDLDNANIPRLHKKLQDHLPVNGASDIRSWEWHYLLAASRQEQTTFFGHRRQVEDVAWSPDGKRIASVGYDGVRIWGAATGRELHRNQEGRTMKRAGAWNPGSSRFAWGSAAPENAIRIWDCKSNEVIKLNGHNNSLSSMH